MRDLVQPKQFGVEYAGIFQDASVVAAYHHRPSYQAETFRLLAGLIDRAQTPVRVLDAGCGTGQMTEGLLPYVDEIDAVDLSSAMIKAGQQMPYGASPQIRWVVGGMESVTLRPPYGLIVAAASLHWMPWAETLPRFAEALSADGYLALVEQRILPTPWADELKPLFARYSMNRDFQPYNMATVAAELTTHGLFQQSGVLEATPVAFVQPIDGWVEAIHARNGFSRDRMDPTAAAEFDQLVRTIVLRHYPDGEVPQQIQARILFGKPLAS